MEVDCGRSFTLPRKKNRQILILLVVGITRLKPEGPPCHNSRGTKTQYAKRYGADTSCSRFEQVRVPSSRDKRQSRVTWEKAQFGARSQS